MGSWPWLSFEFIEEAATAGTGNGSIAQIRQEVRHIHFELHSVIGCDSERLAASHPPSPPFAPFVC